MGAYPAPIPVPVAPCQIVDGLEDRVVPTIVRLFLVFYRQVPSVSNGKYDDAGVLIDPWSQGYGYAVSNLDVAGDKIMVTPNGIRTAGIPAAVPDLFVCSDSAVLGNHADCAAAGSNLVVGNVAVVLISLGMDYDIARNIEYSGRKCRRFR